MTGKTTYRAHLFNNIGLLFLSVLALPLSTSILVLSYIYQYVYPKAIPQLPPSERKTVLVTSTRMTKCLTICRALHLAGHKVIAAEIRPWGRFSANRFSSSVTTYYELPEPTKDSEAYIAAIQEVIRKEKVDLWIPCSGVASTEEDAVAKIRVQDTTKVIQFTPEMCKILHEKNTFIDETKKVGLNTPYTEYFTDRNSLEQKLFSEEKSGKEYILKCVALDDVSRADMTILPRPTRQQTLAFLDNIEISPNWPWVLQEFIRGKEYCTHSVVIDGQVKAFVACESSELLMHYVAISKDDRLSKAMEEFTKTYARERNLTGQLSFDFMIKSGSSTSEEIVLYPIECNPRCHTAVALFEDQPVELANAYLNNSEKVLYATPGLKGRYWVGHDIVQLVLVPLLSVLTGEGETQELLKGLSATLQHMIGWKDATYETWDPLPWWYLYHVHWPALFLQSLLTGERWTRVNISTTRVFLSELKH